MANDKPIQLRPKRWMALVLVPVFYVLSIGPVVWIAALVSRWFHIDIAIHETPIFQMLYAPLRFAAAHSTWVSDFVVWYILLPFQ